MSQNNTPAGDFTQTPEFKKAVADAASAAADAAVKQAIASLPQPAPASGDLGAILGNLAMQIAELNGQQTGGNKPVDPALVKKREQAGERMWALIRKAREEGRPATYRLKGQQFLADTLIESTYVRQTDRTHQPTEIDWELAPNDHMEPVNETAQEIYAAFKEHISGTLNPVREKQGFFLKGGVVVKQGDKHEAIGASADEMRVAAALEQAAVSGLKVHQEGASGYEMQQVLGTTSAGRAMVQR